MVVIEKSIVITWNVCIPPSYWFNQATKISCGYDPWYFKIFEAGIFNKKERNWNLEWVWISGSECAWRYPSPWLCETHVTMVLTEMTPSSWSTSSKSNFHTSLCAFWGTHPTGHGGGGGGGARMKSRSWIHVIFILPLLQSSAVVAMWGNLCVREDLFQHIKSCF